MPQNSLAFVMNGQKQSAQGPSLCFYSHRFTFSNRLSRRRTWFKWPKRFLPDCEGANGSKPWSDPGDDSASDIFWAVPVRVVSNIFFTGTKGEDSQFDAYFSNGWNHQLVIVPFSGSRWAMTLFHAIPLSWGFSVPLTTWQWKPTLSLSTFISALLNSRYAAQIKLIQYLILFYI